MPHTPSAEKRLRKAEKRRKHNRTVAKVIKGKRREIGELLVGKDPAKTVEGMKVVQATLDRAAAKGYIHANKAARLKSRLVKRQRAATAK